MCLNIPTSIVINIVVKKIVGTFATTQTTYQDCGHALALDMPIFWLGLLGSNQTYP
jgi:hypothetical protein